MIKESYDVILVDFSGILPFRLEKEGILTPQETIAMESLSKFLLDLESSMKDQFVYLGMDFLEAKLFHRLMVRDGVVDLLIGTPITLLGHFKGKESAEEFKDSLQATLGRTIPERLLPLLDEAIEIRKIDREIEPNYNKVGFSKLG